MQATVASSQQRAAGLAGSSSGGSGSAALRAASGAAAAPPRQQLRSRRAGLALRVQASAAADAAKDVLERAADRSTPPAREPGFDARGFRRSLNTTGRYTRKPSNDPDSLQLMEEHGVGYSTTGLVAQMRETGYVWKQGDVTVKLAEAYGFCWGVERAVQMAYEARKAYPGQRLHITNEIIHNPGGCWPAGGRVGGVLAGWLAGCMGAEFIVRVVYA